MDILIFRGKCKNNGISTALVNLLKYIDLSKCNVTLLLVKDRKFKDSGVAEQIPARVKIVWKKTSLLGMLIEQIVRKTDLPLAKTGFFKRFVNRDIKKLFGGRVFDDVIDFDGYNLYYDHMLLSMPGKKSIWLHNDMYAEMMVRSPWLKRTFALYKEFDNVVSCGLGVNAVNKAQLSEKYGIPENKFKHAENLPNVERVLKLAKERCDISLPRGKKIFITVGRCSIEKNHQTLIKAFSRLHKRYPDTVLVIAGTGPDFDGERLLASTLIKDGSIIMTGLLNNPYSLMKKCDCFVLPSLHEGQPMVVTEARILHMPIVLAGFSTVKGCTMPNGQLVVVNDEEGLYSGMEAYLKSQVPKDYPFNAPMLIKNAIKGFFDAIS